MSLLIADNVSANVFKGRVFEGHIVNGV